MLFRITTIDVRTNYYYQYIIYSLYYICYMLGKRYSWLTTQEVIYGSNDETNDC